MIAGFVQHDPRYLDVRWNIDLVADMLSDIRADLLVLPELFATGYHFRSLDDVHAVAESQDDPNAPTLVALKELSDATGATLVAGYVERDGDSLYNSAAVVSGGAVIGNYRKVHLFYKEKSLFSPGRALDVYDVEAGNGVSYRLGVMICFDWYFPEAARSLALQGADVIAHPSNLVRKDCPRSMPIRALENHVFTITANRIGTEVADAEELSFIGQSRACNPSGDVVAEMGKSETGLAVFEFDPLSARERQITATNHLLNDRKPEAYVLD